MPTMRIGSLCANCAEPSANGDHPADNPTDGKIFIIIQRLALTGHNQPGAPKSEIKYQHPVLQVLPAAKMDPHARA